MSPAADSDSDEPFQNHYASSSASSSEESPSQPASPPAPAYNFFAPPFYNRPPTPLPPSPSLTSLLRPSRPTTPDSSDAEFEPVPRASPKIPTYEYYGFVLYLVSNLAFLIYLLWSYLPSPFLHAFGIYYYPNRWWSLAIPSFLVMLIIYIYVALASYNTGYLTLPLESIETIVDNAGMVATVDSHGRLVGRDGRDAKRKSKNGSVANSSQTRGKSREDWRWKDVWNVGTDAVMDVPLGGVCEVLYGEQRDLTEDEFEETT